MVIHFGFSLILLSEFIITLGKKNLRVLWLDKVRLRSEYVNILKPRHPGEVKYLRSSYAVFTSSLLLP